MRFLLEFLLIVSPLAHQWEKVFKALGLRSMYLQNCGIYLRVNVIGAQDFEPSDRSQPPQAFVKTTELFTPNGTISKILGLGHWKETKDT
ncbi:unnamed protein product, partial [Brassica oleracea var. botrytis]